MVVLVRKMANMFARMSAVSQTTLGTQRLLGRASTSQSAHLTVAAHAQVMVRLVQASVQD
jgi:hypothetical protein